jgi:hypothetical protein
MIVSAGAFCAFIALRYLALCGSSLGFIVPCVKRLTALPSSPHCSVIQSEALTGASNWMSVVWTFMTLKWAFGLFWAVHTHTRKLVRSPAAASAQSAGAADSDRPIHDAAPIA